MHSTVERFAGWDGGFWGEGEAIIENPGFPARGFAISVGVVMEASRSCDIIAAIQGFQRVFWQGRGGGVSGPLRTTASNLLLGLFRAIICGCILVGAVRFALRTTYSARFLVIKACQEFDRNLQGTRFLQGFIVLFLHSWGGSLGKVWGYLLLPSHENLVV